MNKNVICIQEIIHFLYYLSKFDSSTLHTLTKLLNKLKSSTEPFTIVAKLGTENTKTISVVGTETVMKVNLILTNISDCYAASCIDNSPHGLK